MKKQTTYYLGLDIGTDSVGAAAVDERYRPLKFKGEPIMVSHLFDQASQCAERRAFRTARRRLDRRQQRVALVDEIFAPEIAKLDPGFYIRRRESALNLEDKSNKGCKWVNFTGDDYSEIQYYSDYPTIHHLLRDLIRNREKKFDLRLINIAVDWLVAHRGHFLSEVSTDNIESILDFRVVYEEFSTSLGRLGMEMPWDRIDPEGLGNILKKKGINRKKKELADFLYGGKIPQKDEYPLDRKVLIALLAGGVVKASDLFVDSEYEDLSFSFNKMDALLEVLPQLGDDGEIVAKLAMMYDWSVLSDILPMSHSGEPTYLSDAKVAMYEQHGEDLKDLKRFVRKYEKKGTLKKGTYYEIFRKADAKLKNYTAYSYNLKSFRNKSTRDLPDGKASKEDFYAFLKKELQLDSFVCEEEDKSFLDDLKLKIEEGTFLPKQVNTDNRVIPYQLYWMELVKILDNASAHYPFLTEVDGDGYNNIQKLKDIFKFRIPYYVGPLVSNEKSPYAWMKRKAEGRIYPWNFESMVDLDGSENAFIARMTNQCTYLPGESVLPKWSLLYSRFTVLNEINNIKVNGVPISVEAKQGIYNDLFSRMMKVTPKKIREYLLSRGLIQQSDELGGLDITIKSSLKAQCEFRRLMDNNLLSEIDVERVIERSTCTEEKDRFRKWLKQEFPNLNEEDRKYVSRLKYADFGRLSRKLLTGMEGADKDTGEAGTIMHFLWGTNDNLMQLLSDRYTFMDSIEAWRQDYYAEHSQTVSAQLEEMGVSNAVKRPIIRTLDVVKDIVSAVGCAPTKIFVEMARGEDKDKKRTKSRLEQIRSLYQTAEEDTRILEKQLEEMGDTANNQLQSDSLFLYYLQMGKCMYSGNPINLSQLKSTKYNIDHIYPQSLVKDDSLLNNRVLVESEINGEKSDIYPVRADIRQKMAPFWRMLCKNGLITKEKFERLVRNTPLTDDEKLGFIKRQLVETRQSTKAVSQVLKSLYPDAVIVYVKASLASEFRQEFLFPKARSINDLHHAKDAYLNVVVGNVYHERFTKKWFNVHEKYSVRTKTLFTRDLAHGECVIWNPAADLQTVKQVYAKNSIHLTRFAYCAKGGLFDQMPLKKGMGQVSLKKGADTEKYGGYNKAAASFFVIVKYTRGEKNEVSFVPVELMVAEHFLEDAAYASQYAKDQLEKINTKKIENISFPLGKRVVKIKSMISIDGYRVWINGKANGGKIVLLSNAESLILPEKWSSYVKKMESYSEKKKKNRSILHDSVHDGLSESDNEELFEVLLSKLANPHFQKMPGCQYQTLLDGKKAFASLGFDDQIKTLMNMVNLMKSGRTGGCDLSLVGGKSASGAMTLGANLSSTKASDIRLIDTSPAGVHMNPSMNLLELLK